MHVGMLHIDREEGKSRVTSVCTPTPPLPCRTEKQSMKKHWVLFFSILVMALGAAAAADLQVQQQQQHWSTSRSLLQQAPPKIDCPSACLVRCSNNWKNEMCNKMCNVCCNHCSCVPPGTGQDTRHICPCYDTMVNPHTKKLKCP